MPAPLFSPGDVVYIRESAAVGKLETIVAGNVFSQSGQWWYEITEGSRVPAPPLFGEKVTGKKEFTRAFPESELLTFCDAADIAEAYLGRALAEIVDQKQRLC